jgi:hypothetical protein
MQLNSYKHGFVVPASTSEPQKELSKAPVSQSISTVSAPVGLEIKGDKHGDSERKVSK